MIRYLFATAAARLAKGKSLFVLTAFGVVLGVASVLSIQIINRNALAAFRGSLEAVSGQADLSILGTGPTFPEELYVRVLADSGIEAAWPAYRVSVALAARDQMFLDLVGVDLFQVTGLPLDSGTTDVGEALRTTGWVALTPKLANDLAIQPGDTIVTSLGSRRVSLVVGLSKAPEYKQREAATSHDDHRFLSNPPPCLTAGYGVGGESENRFIQPAGGVLSRRSKLHVVT